MKIYCLKDKMPPKEILDGEEECWWWDALDQCWRIGSVMLFDDLSIGARYTHWTAKENISEPKVVNHWRFNWRVYYNDKYKR